MPVYLFSMGVHMWSEKVVKVITRPDWMVASGNIPKQVHLLVTPRVVVSGFHSSSTWSQSCIFSTLTSWAPVFSSIDIVGSFRKLYRIVNILQ